MGKIYVEMTEQEYEEYKNLKTPEGALSNFLLASKDCLEKKQGRFQDAFMMGEKLVTKFIGRINDYNIEITKEERL